MAFPFHFERFIENREEVKRLVNIHIKVAGVNPGRKSEVQVLHKSAIVLLVACWESYIEMIVSDGFDFMLAMAPSYDVFPNSVLVKASKELRTDKDERRIWELANNGWKTVLERYKEGTFKKEIDYFHVPRATNIDDLFSRLIGLEYLSRNWSWKGQKYVDSVATLDNLIDLRGSISHKIQIDNSIQKKDVLYFLNFVNNLTVATNNAVSRYIERKVGTKPWETYTYKVKRKF